MCKYDISVLLRVDEADENRTGAKQIFIFDHTVRRAPKDNRSGKDSRGPVQRVHIDQSYAASPNRVLHHLPDDAEKLLRGRYQIINVWRPIRTIFKDPLAIADARTVPDSDLVPSKLVYPDREGETYAIRPGPLQSETKAASNPSQLQHRWYYRSGQTPDLVTLIKCFDSKTDGRARRVPHSAFVDPEFDRDGVSGRESIEVRTLVFHPDDQD